jgi:hypothetical protein
MGIPVFQVNRFSHIVGEKKPRSSGVLVEADA